MTLKDLYRKVLEKLTVVSSGTPVDPDDEKTVRDKYATLYETLDTEELVNWTATADVPEFAAQPLIAMLAFMCANEFGQQAEGFAQEGALFLPQMSLAERQLRRAMAARYISAPQKTEYF